MNLKDCLLIDNFVEGSGVATMRINRPIANNEEDGITGVRFSNEWDYLVNVLGVKKIIVAINSVGGSMFQGLEIFSTIQDAEIDTETRVVGLAGSIAGVISQAGKRKTIKAHSLFHAHAPFAEGGAKVSNDVLKISFDSIKTIMKNNSTMNDEEVTDMLSKESYYSPDEAKELGFFDEVLSSGRVFDVNNKMDSTELMDIFNQIDNKGGTPTKDMSKINEVLGLKSEASETAQLSELTTLKARASKVGDLEKASTEKDAEITSLKAKLEVEAGAKATELIENACKSGQIDGSDEEVKTSWIANATTNYEGTKAMLSGLPSVAISNKIPTNGTDAPNNENRKDWGFDKWSQEDPKGLDAMQVNDSAKFEKLLNAYTEA